MVILISYTSRLFSLIWMGNLQEGGELTWRLSDCEELVGAYRQK